MVDGGETYVQELDQQLGAQQIQISDQKTIPLAGLDELSNAASVPVVHPLTCPRVLEHLNAMLEAAFELQHSLHPLAAGSVAGGSEIGGVMTQHRDVMAPLLQTPAVVTHAAAIPPQLLRRVQIGDQQNLQR